MAFKIKAPFHIEGKGSTIDPGKKINLTKKDSPDFAKSGVGSKIISYQQYRDSGAVPKGMESVFSGKGSLRVSKSFTGKKSSGEGTGQGSGSSIKGTSADTRTYNPFSTKTKVKKIKSQVTKDGEAGYEADDKARKNKTGIYAPKKRKKVTATETPKQIGVKRGDYGHGVKTKKGTAKGLDVKAPEISTKKPTVKVAPKDNSRKAIKKRKTADKAAGVSKSQMRANKAKSKSEAALAKAKKSKNPDFRAQLKRKSDRLAARAKRKGGSPAKEIGDPKNPKRKYGKVTVKKEKKDGVTTVTATRSYSTSGGKKTYKQFEKEGGDVAAAKKFNKGKETKSITIVDKKPKGVKAIPTKSHKPKIDLKAKPKKGGSGVKTTVVPGKKKKQPKITKAKVRGNRKLSGLGRVKGCK